MSDEAPGKPKPGSLKDRIAAFNQQATQAPPPRPVPSAKPVNWAWKQKQVETTAAPAPSSSSVPSGVSSSIPPKEVDEQTDKRAGMSASDAKESIQKGGSLKERMALLQGKGAFGAGADPAPKPPVSEKPRVWKKPVVIPSPDASDEASSAPLSIIRPTQSSDDAERSTSDFAGASPKGPSNPEAAEATEEALHQDAPEEEDEEEVERKRRATIAARMAKLGGARVGMGPPIFGRNPTAPQPTQAKSPLSSSPEIVSPEHLHNTENVDNPPTPSRKSSLRVPKVGDDTSAMGADSSSSILAPGRPVDETSGPEAAELDPSASETRPPAAPESKPLQVPRRALPPRKKSSKKLHAEEEEKNEPSAPPPPPLPVDSDEPLGESATSAPAVEEAVTLPPVESTSVESTLVEQTRDEEERTPSETVTGAESEFERSGLKVPSPPTVQTESLLKPTSPSNQPSPVSPSTALGQTVLSTLIQPPELSDEDADEDEDSIPSKRHEAISAEPARSVDPELIGEIDARALGPPEIESAEEDSEEEERQRRQKLAQRMANLGGVGMFEPPSSAPARRDSIEAPVEHAEPEIEEVDDTISSPQSPVAAPSPPARRSLPPPPRPFSEPKPQEEVSSRLSIETTQEPSSPVEKLSSPVSQRRSIPLVAASAPVPPVFRSESDNEEENQSDTWSEPSSPALRSVPPHPQPGLDSLHAEQREEVAAGAKDASPEDDAPPPPVNRASRPPVPTSFTRPISIQQPKDDEVSSPQSDAPPTSPAAPRHDKQGRRTTLPPPPIAARPPVDIVEPDAELMDEADTDPIDPTFFAPPRSPISTRHDTSFPPPKAPSSPAEEHDAESVRRQTIAERMAKLGGVKFGVPGMAPPPPRRQVSVPQEAVSVDDAEPTEGNVPTVNDEEEEETEEQARARRAAIAARLAGSGGMRFGMIPGATPAPPSVLPPPDENFSELATDELESVPETSLMSDDGVEVEAEESELEEVIVEDPVPPPPPRPSRPPPSSEAATARGQAPPPLPAGRPGRPPMPAGFNARKASSDHQPPTSPRATATEYVLVDEPEEVSATPPPPPPRTGANRRSLPPPPPPSHPPPSNQPTVAPSDLSQSQWELPAIPTSKLEMSETHSDDDTAYPPATPVASPPSRRSSAIPQAHPPAQRSANEPVPSRTSEELMVVWGKLGTQVIAHASELAEHAKKSVIGDGSSEGFVHAALSRVPHVQYDGPYGYLIYAQSGSSVQRRASDIMPGDVFTLEDARFKGHKGLTSYSLHVGGDGVPLVGIVHEFEAKKSKIRIYQAAMHPNSYPTVETVSYRLEDLKSGSVKVYRVVDA